VGFPILLCGCTTVSSLQTTTLSQGGTASEILSQMVLDNLEMIRQSPGALPWHLKITQGGIGVTDQISPSFNVTWPNVSRTAGLSGSRQWSVSWTVVPELAKARLVALQGLYQKEACKDPSVTDEARVTCEVKFQEYYAEGTVAPLDGPSGGFRGKHIWPKDLSHLTEFVTDILAAAPIEPAERGLMLPGPQRF